MSDSAQRRSEEFLRIADQFKLGKLLSEASHPVTARLSEVARNDVAAALGLLFRVDEDVLRVYRQVAESGRLERITDDVFTAVRQGGRIFLTGCGSTGRLSILLDSIWREYWREIRAAGLRSDPSVDDWENRTFSVMAGGDYALIKAVEGFEDYTAFGRKQLRDLGVRAGDVVFAITEGGETSFVIGTAGEGAESGAKVYFVYNNPDDLLCRHIRRSREVLTDPRIENLNLTTGPMAISGSTRMQATTIQLCVLVTVLEMVARRLSTVPNASGMDGHGTDNVEDVPQGFLQGLESLHQTLLSDRILDGLATLVRAEVQAYRSEGRANYHADRLAIDVLTDTTERSPTFSTPPFKKVDDRSAGESMAFLFVPGRSTPEAWCWLLKRSPRCLEWSRAEVEGLLPADRLERTMEILGNISTPELLRFGIGREGMALRPLRKHDFCLTIAAGEDRILEEGVGTPISSAKDGGAGCRMVLCFKPQGQVTASHDSGVVEVPVAQSGFVLDGLTRVAVKMVLNAISTCVMVCLGRVMGNAMIYVVPSNLKLIDRATRYISQLGELGYQDANRLLFEAMEYVEPRMTAGQDHPPVVGLAVLRARKRMEFAEAEKMLHTAFAGM